MVSWSAVAGTARGGPWLSISTHNRERDRRVRLSHSETESGAATPTENNIVVCSVSGPGDARRGPSRTVGVS